MSELKQIIGRTFMELAEGLETGSFGKKPRIALTGLGSEHGEENAMAAARAAAKEGRRRCNDALPVPDRRVYGRTRGHACART